MMHKIPAVLTVLAVGSFSVSGAGLIPAEDFARPPKFSHITLSPDGEYVGFIREHEGVDRMCFMEIATKKLEVLNLGQGKFIPCERGVFGYDWISPKRVVIRTSLDFFSGGWMAADRDRKNPKALSGDIAVRDGVYGSAYGFSPSSIIHEFEDGRKILVASPRSDQGVSAAQFPDVIKLDTITGIGTTAVRNPGNVRFWGADREGHVRMGVTFEKNRETVIYRDSEKDEWQTVASFEGEQGISPIGFTEDGKRVYIETKPKDGPSGVYVFDPGKKELGELVWSDPTYESGTLIQEPVSRKLVGVGYWAETWQTRWFDEKYVALQASVDASLPGKVNVLRSISRDEKRMLVESFSERDPVIAYLFDIGTGKLHELGKSRGWINSDEMAQMFSITYEARDGLKIHGYLTVPHGMKPKNLPLVVMPHGGPSARDVWMFNPMVQMLANRGYAVLQMNYRGSTGYGHAFREKGSREVGGKIQEDIEDATQWAIAKKVADPKRIAIMGASYGGYSALYALGKSPDLYCCGISIAGVTDWPGIYGEINPDLDIVQKYWRHLFGDPEKEADRLREISPVYFADKITAPVLIIQGKEDRVVPPRQANKMIAALTKAGRKPQSLFIPDEAHGFRREKGRLAQFKAVEEFLAKHLGGPVVPSPAEPK